MSENKKPENLLAEIAFSKRRVHTSHYKYGKFTHADEIASFLNAGLSDDEVEEAVLRELGRLLQGQKCGVVVEAPRTSDSDTVIRVYALPDRLKSHRLKVDGDLLTSSGWLQRFLHSLNPLSVYSDAAARGEIGLTSTATGTVSDKLHLFADRNDQRERVEATEEKLSPSEWVKKNLPNGSRMFVDCTSPIMLGEKWDDTLDPTDHIPALRGLFAFARGNYTTVSPEDLTAAVDAGYVHPDVLSCVADEIAYASGTSA